MPNLCSFDGVVFLPADQAEKFFAFFDEQKKSDGHIHYTTIIEKECLSDESDENGLVEYSFYGQCAWSCASCWERSERGEGNEKTVPLIKALKECRVSHFRGTSEEIGFNFFECFCYNSGDQELTLVEFPFR